MIVKVLNSMVWRKPFKLFDYWMKHPDFNTIVSQVWEDLREGVPMYKLVCKLKSLSSPQAA